MDLKSFIREVPNFPQPGVFFKDISPLLASPTALNQICHQFGQKIEFSQIDLIAGIESRGFILGMLLANHFEKGFVPLRKMGKLPPPVLAESYSLEYGQATIECNPGHGRVLIIDDVLATGGTLQAAINLSTRAGYEVKDVAVLINLKFLNQMKFNQREIVSLCDYLS